MANNRIYIKCKICGVGHAIAKYYPVGDGAGWYCTHDTEQRTNDFFGAHEHDQDGTNFGGFQYEMEYEVLPPKQGITKLKEELK